jgi:hypothetical protein
VKIGVRARVVILALLLAASPAFAQERTLTLPNGEELRYRVIIDASESAQPAAMQLLRHLAVGEIGAAAAMSNAPQQRLEVLQEFQRSVGEDQFKRLFGRYFAPDNRILMEAAIGKHRLVVWDLGEARHQLAGQYFVEVEGRFLMDDVASAERSKLQRVLEAQRRTTDN